MKEVAVRVLNAPNHIGNVGWLIPEGAGLALEYVVTAMVFSLRDPFVGDLVELTEIPDDALVVGTYDYTFEKIKISGAWLSAQRGKDD